MLDTYVRRRTRSLDAIGLQKKFVCTYGACMYIHTVANSTRLHYIQSWRQCSAYIRHTQKARAHVLLGEPVHVSAEAGVMLCRKTASAVFTILACCRRRRRSW